MRSFFILAVVLLMTVISVQAQTGFDEQISLIAANADLWKQDVEYGVWGYVVTDLNKNDRPEIISCSVQGTGFYSYIKAYEVNEEGTGLNDLMEKLNLRTDSSPDIMVTSAPVYFDKEAGRYYYIFDDMIRVGMTEYHENKRAVSIIDGLWEETTLAVKNTVYTDADHAEITCFDGNGNGISEAQYAAIADSVYGNLEAGEACFNWVTTESADFAALSPSQLAENLRTAADSACLSHAQ